MTLQPMNPCISCSGKETTMFWYERVWIMYPESCQHLLNCKWVNNVMKGKYWLEALHWWLAYNFVSHTITLDWYLCWSYFKIKNLTTPNRSCTKLCDEHATALGHSNLPADNLHLRNTWWCVWCNTWSTASHHTSICCNKKIIIITH